MIAIDATPLQTVNRHHGIGAYTAGLLDALTDPSRKDAHVGPLGLLLQEARPDDLPLAAALAARPDVRLIPVRQPQWRLERYQWVIDRLQLLVHHGFVAAAVKRARARVYHATEPFGLVVVPGSATVATLYDLIPLHYPAAFFPPRWLDLRAEYARYLHQARRADHLIAISEATKQDAVLRLRIPPERISVTPLAVDDKRFYPRTVAQVSDALTRHHLRQPYFLHVGSSAHHKNSAALVRAFDLYCCEAGADHALYVTGSWEPRSRADLEASYRHLVDNGRLRLLGLVPGADLPALYSGATALAYPSLIEGFGLPVLEAMRCATPVLTSNISSLPEVGGDAALYVDPHNVEEIAAGLRQLAEQSTLRAGLVERGMRRADGFTWTRTAERTLQAYRELL